MSRAPDLSYDVLDGRYELHALIGEGTFGRVYRGLDRRLARPVAVKVIKPWWAEDSAWVERFEREAQLLARVSDPGIVQIYDIGHAASGPYYVAELIDGDSLAERLRGGPLRAREAHAVAEQLCEALAGAHAQGIVHCDVKPANILITAAQKVKVGDFGLARLAEGSSQAPSATVAGTPRYMSPEQARGQLTGPATDVYSAGVVLYEMLAGEPPFAHGSAVELGLRHVQDEPPPLPSEVPASLREVVGRALAKDPRDRYRDGAAMAEALRSAGPPAARPRHDAVDRDGAVHALSSRARASRADSAASAIADPPTVDHSRASTVLAPAAATRVMSTRLRASSPASPRWASVPPRRQGAGMRGAGTGVGRVRVALLAVVLLASLGVLAIVVLSSGPACVTVPGVVGRSALSAEHLLARAGLRYRTRTVAAPGSEPGIVTHQSPASATTALRRSTVALSIAETPRWRVLTTFSGVDDGRSVPFRILGEKWKVVYHMAYQGLCTLLLVCFGPSAEVENLHTGSTFGGFKLGDGETETQTFADPGLYQLVIAGGHDSAHWSMTVEDYY